jgi:hypothetical protein
LFVCETPFTFPLQRERVRGRKFSMDMKAEIKKLARIGEGPYPFLSLYLDTKWDHEQQRERIRLFIKNELKRIYDQVKDRSRQKAFIEDQKQVEKYVEGLVRRATNEEVNGGRVQTLYLLTSFSRSGGKCRRCSSLAPVSTLGAPFIHCPLCKGEMKMTDLGEERVRSTLRQVGEVKWVEEDVALKESDGVGASLRFRPPH